MQKKREKGRAVVRSGAAIRQYASNDNHEPLGKVKGKHKPGTGKQVYTGSLFVLCSTEYSTTGITVVRIGNLPAR